jgi:proline iminopeptidase
MLPRLFDPTAYHVVTFDQRGCGESQCDDRLMGNTLNDLIDDVEKVREHLGLDRCSVPASCAGLARDSEPHALA